MKTIYMSNVLKEINQCERLANIYNNLYQLLSCPSFEAIDFDSNDRKQLDKELSNGYVESLEDLGNRFDELADFYYKKANRLLKTDYKRAI